MRNSKIVNFLSAVVLLVAVQFLVPLGTQAAPASDSEEVSKLLDQAKLQATQLKRDSATLESYTRSKLSWQSHAAQLNIIKEHINGLGQTAQKLSDARGDASSWQQDAIDRIVPLLKDLASNTEAAIGHLNSNQQHLHDPQYQQYLRSNYEVATDLTTLVGDFVAYGQHKAKFEGLQSKLEVGQ